AHHPPASANSHPSLPDALPISSFPTPARPGREHASSGRMGPGGAACVLDLPRAGGEVAGVDAARGHRPREPRLVALGRGPARQEIGRAHVWAPVTDQAPLPTSD